MTSTVAIARLTAQIEAIEDQLVALRHRRPSAEPAPDGTVQYLRNKHSELADRLATEMRAVKTGSAIAWTGMRLFRVERRGIVQRTIERALRSSVFQPHPRRADDRL
jgi:hypothetical protein